MTKKELQEVESILKDLEDSDDKIDILESLYTYIKGVYIEQCNQ